MTGTLGPRVTYAIGSVITVASLAGIYFQPVHTVQWLIYITSFFLGVGTTIILVGAVSMEADLVGEHVATGAFVYGFISLLDKLSNGLVIKFTSPFSDNGFDVLRLETLAPGSATILSLLMVLTIKEYWVGAKTKKKQEVNVQQKIQRSESVLEKEPLLLHDSSRMYDIQTTHT